MTEALMQEFQERLAALAATALRPADEGAAVAAVLAALQERAVTEVIAWDDPLLSRLGLPAAARAVGIAWYTATPDRDPAEVRAVAARAGAGITGADWAIAETGTLALMGGPGRPRSTNVLPPLHIAVVPVSRLLPSIAALFGQLSQVAAAGRIPSGLHLVTGPSRSADIEDVLVRKVHGPGELLVLILPSESLT